MLPKPQDPQVVQEFRAQGLGNYILNFRLYRPRAGETTTNTAVFPKLDLCLGWSKRSQKEKTV